MFYKNLFFVFSYIISTSYFLSSCLSTSHSESILFFNNEGWSEKDSIKKIIYVEDTSERYMIYFITKHTTDYPYKNLWIELTITDPENNSQKTSQELTLARNDIGWLGVGMMNIFEEKIPWRNFQPKKKGKYSIQCSQINREKTLKEFKSFSIYLKKYYAN